VAEPRDRGHGGAAGSALLVRAAAARACDRSRVM
jgi:hypothetical protein